MILKNFGLYLLFAALMSISLLSGCTGAQQPPFNAGRAQQNKEILILYLSRTNNTKAVAEMIHQNVGGKVVPIELEKPYPEDYRTTVEQVARENETGYLPPLKTSIDRIEQYEVVFIGFPTWGMQLPPPIKSFLRRSNLRGKTIVPFNTHAGYGVGSSFETIRELAPESNILEGFSTRGGIERDGVSLAIKEARAKEVVGEVTDWLRRINMLK